MEQVKFPIKLKLDAERKIVDLRETVIATANGVEVNDEPSPFEGKVLSFKSVDTTSKKGGYAERPFVPNDLKAFAADPGNVPLPKSIKSISMSRGMDIEKLANDSVKGQMVLGFDSHVEKSVGDDKVRRFYFSYDMDNPIDVESFEEEEMTISGIGYELD